MFRTEPFTGSVANCDTPNLAWHLPVVREITPDAARHNDPLAGMTPWQIYQRCIWISDEDANTKISLLALSRYMNKDLKRGSSMSYSQLARDCGFSLATAKRFAKNMADVDREIIWVTVGVGKGRYVPGKGNENSYNGVIPPRWEEELRSRMRGGISVKPDEEIAEALGDLMAGDVSEGHPEPQTDVSRRHPEGERGITQTPPTCHTDTLTPYFSLKKKGVPPENGVSHIHPGSSPQIDAKAKMAASLNPEVAYAELNVTVTHSGKLVIGDAFRAELRQAFTDEQIDGGVDCTLAAMGTDRNKVKILAQVRRQCTFKLENDRKANTRKPKSTTGVF